MSQTCLITGGARGIGRATALLAAAAGYRVAVAGLPEHRADGEEVVSRIAAAGGTAVALQGDVADPADIERLFDESERALGRLTALVNAAGIAHGSRVEDFSFDGISRLMAVNVVGLMYCCREAARRMSTAHGGAGGAIVNISSMAATIGGRPGASAYAASKAAVDVFTTGFAKEVAREGIRVNTVRPGVVVTAMTTHFQQDAELRQRIEASIPLGRMGRPEEIAEVIVWLLSDKASLVTGAHVNAGGGGFLVAG